MISDSNLLTFRAISTFVTDLSEIYCENQHSLALYARLLEKTSIIHEGPIIKHIESFRKFCVDNRDKIFQKDSELINNEIRYSEKVYIDMKEIFELCKNDLDTTATIWQHILTISAFVDPTGKAKQILKQNVNKKEIVQKNDDTPTNEEDFLQDIFNKVENTVDPNSDPMSAISGIMNSGIFTELVGGMQNGLQDGSLNINKLMGSVQGMVSKLGDETDGVNMNDSINMIQNMMSGMDNLNNTKKLEN